MFPFQKLCVPLPIAFTVATDDGGNWLSATTLQNAGRIPLTPAVVTISANPQLLFPGVYHGHVTITSPPGASNPVVVPITFTVTPASPLSGPPLVASLVNAASGLAGPLAPGEIVTLFGLDFGPTIPRASTSARTAS